jgi:hypothetical protein
MTPRPEVGAQELRHALNNLLTKILGAADLALVEAPGPQVRAELETILSLAQEGAALVAYLSASPPAR